MTLERAIALAAQLHEGQEDKAGAHYILHPLRVMFRLTTESDRRVGVLHDVVEDCGVTPECLLRLGLPAEEVEAIQALTKRPDEDGSDEGYARFIERAGRSPQARRVKLADLADNLDESRLGSLTDKDRARLAKYERARSALQAMG